MCGRLNITDDPFTIDLLKYFGVDLGIRPRLPLYNMGPSERIPIIFEQGGARTSSFAIWSFLLESTPTGLKPKSGLSTFNAKAQRLTESRLWQTPYKSSRCIIPASGFYEFKNVNRKKYPYLIKPVDRAIGFAGLFREWHYKGDIIHSCALIVTLPHPKLSHIHDKSFPVLMSKEHIDPWLDPAIDPTIKDTERFKPLYEPRLRTDFVAIPTNPFFNSPKNKNRNCLEPIGESESICAD
jgi:putative SOS response-associated peptidase YedK